MTTVRCAGCGLLMQSDLTPEETLAEVQKSDPEVQEVTFFCQVCLALAEAEGSIPRPADDSNEDR